MEWSRVKNILIVLLVIVNAFLFVMYLSTTVEDAKEDEAFVNHTVSVLSKNNIKIDGGIIPRKSPLLYSAMTSVKTEAQLEKKLVEKMDVTDVNSERIQDIATGESSFSCTFKTKVPESADQALQIYAKAASNAGIEIDSPYVEEKNGGYIVRGWQKLMGVPVCNGMLILAIDGNGDGKFMGATVADDATTVETSAPHDICSVLVAAIDHLPPGEITGISRAYHYSLKGESIYYLPVWKISMSDSYFFLSAMNGDIVELTY